MSEESNLRCCICLGTEHDCANPNECCCVPLMFFCSTCASGDDNSDKRACADCLQRMMAEYAREGTAGNDDQSMIPQLKATTMTEFREEIGKLIGAKFVFASILMHKSFLHTIERIVMKGVLFNRYCPTSFLCVVSTIPDLVPVQGLLVRMLFAQRWFSKSTTATFLNHYKNTSRVFERIPVDKVAFLQRAHLLDSCIAVHLPKNNYKEFLINLLNNATPQQSQVAQHVYDSLTQIFDEFYDSTLPSFEEIMQIHANRRTESQEESQNANAAPLQRVEKEILCPMCRKNCKVSSYIQSATEKEELARLFVNDVNNPKTESKCEKSTWDIRKEQRRVTMVFDETDIEKQCYCCADTNRFLIEEGKKQQFAYKSFVRKSILVILIALFVMLFIERPIFTVFGIIALLFFETMFDYRKTLQSIGGQRVFDWQIFNHCGCRLLHAVENVLQISSSPGMFAPSIQNESLLTAIKRNIDAVSQNAGNFQNVLNIIIEVQHSTWTGAIVDRSLQFLYSNSITDARSLFVTQIILMIARFYTQSGLLFLSLLRQANCEFLFEKLSETLIQLKTIGDRCRFRLAKSASFAKSMIYLKKKIIDKELTTWQFRSATDRQRLLNQDAEDKKILFERVPNSSNSIDEHELLRVQSLQEKDYNKIPFFKRWILQLKLIKSLIVKPVSQLLVNGVIFASYPGHERNQGAEVEFLVGSVLGYCGRTFFDCIMYNAFVLKVMLCFFYGWGFNDSELIYKITAAGVLFLRIELILLILRLMIPILFKEIWLCSDLSNSSVVTEISNYYANKYFVKFIAESNQPKQDERVSVDAIRVGKNLST